jgi:hypothetical protein
VIRRKRDPEPQRPKPAGPGECWMLGCSEEEIALVGGLRLPYIDPEARVCETHDLAHFSGELSDEDCRKLALNMTRPSWADTSQRPRWWRPES